MDVDANITKYLHSGLLLDAWLFHLKVDSGGWCSIDDQDAVSTRVKGGEAQTPLGAHWNGHYICVYLISFDLFDSYSLPSPVPSHFFLHLNGFPVLFSFYLIIWLSSLWFPVGYISVTMKSQPSHFPDLDLKPLHLDSVTSKCAVSHLVTRVWIV